MTVVWVVCWARVYLIKTFVVGVIQNETTCKFYVDEGDTRPQKSADNVNGISGDSFKCTV